MINNKTFFCVLLKNWNLERGHEHELKIAAQSVSQPECACVCVLGSGDGGVTGMIPVGLKKNKKQGPTSTTERTEETTQRHRTQGTGEVQGEGGWEWGSEGVGGRNCGGEAKLYYTVILCNIQ